MHIHLKIDGFPRNRPQMDRTSDIALVYVQGEIEESHFCLLAILDPQAHEKARDPAVMNKLVRMAEAFRHEH
ncbi:mRNA interferase YafO [compost metagenome]